LLRDLPPARPRAILQPGRDRRAALLPGDRAQAWRKERSRRAGARRLPRRLRQHRAAARAGPGAARADAVRRDRLHEGHAAAGGAGFAAGGACGRGTALAFIPEIERGETMEPGKIRLINRGEGGTEADFTQTIAASV